MKKSKVIEQEDPHQQSHAYAKGLYASKEVYKAGKTLIKECLYESAEADQVGVQADVEHPKMAETGLEQIIVSVRDSPSLVWGRPAKSVVERPRGFNSHIPRHITLILSVSIFCCSFGRAIWSIAISRTFSENFGHFKSSPRIFLCQNRRYI